MRARTLCISLLEREGYLKERRGTQVEERFVGLTLEELEGQKVDLLPPREEMQFTLNITTGAATAVNTATVTQTGAAVAVGGDASVWQGSAIDQDAFANTGFVFD
jgi:hypothetical protein